MNGQIQYDHGSALTSEPTPAPISETSSRLGTYPHEPGDPCHFATRVRFGRRRNDQVGHLELTSGRLKFHGALDLSVVWTEIATVERDGRDIVVSLIDSRRVLRFSCPALEDAARGAVVARHLACETALKAVDSKQPINPRRCKLRSTARRSP
jgi:hypothetical protein